MANGQVDQLEQFLKKRRSDPFFLAISNVVFAVVLGIVGFWLSDQVGVVFRPPLSVECSSAGDHLMIRTSPATSGTVDMQVRRQGFQLVDSQGGAVTPVALLKNGDKGNDKEFALNAFIVLDDKLVIRDTDQSLVYVDGWKDQTGRFHPARASVPTSGNKRTLLLLAEDGQNRILISGISSGPKCPLRFEMHPPVIEYAKLILAMAAFFYAIILWLYLSLIFIFHNKERLADRVVNLLLSFASLFAVSALSKTTVPKLWFWSVLCCMLLVFAKNLVTFVALRNQPGEHPLKKKLQKNGWILHSAGYIGLFVILAMVWNYLVLSVRTTGQSVDQVVMLVISCVFFLGGIYLVVHVAHTADWLRGEMSRYAVDNPTEFL